MKEKFWNELADIFFKDENLQKDHAELYENVKLTCDVIKKQHEIQELDKKLTELNKENAQ